MDGNGMYKDVNVMDIDSDTPSDTMLKNKKNPTADLNCYDRNFSKPRKPDLRISDTSTISLYRTFQ